MDSSTSPISTFRQGEHGETHQPQQLTLEQTHLIEDGMNVKQDASPLHPPNQPSTPSPPAVFTNNFSMQTALDQIALPDPSHDSPGLDEDFPPEISRAALISRIRAIRSSGQIQYRVPKRRREGDPKKRKLSEDVEGDQAELSDEVVTVYRQKRVKRAPTRPRERGDRGSSNKHRKSAKEERPSGRGPETPQPHEDSKST